MALCVNAASVAEACEQVVARGRDTNLVIFDMEGVFGTMPVHPDSM